MPGRRRRHVLIGVFASALVLWPSSPAVDTANAGGRITKKFRKEAKVRRFSPAKLTSGTTVLGPFRGPGKYPGYIQKAKRGGHRYFYVHPRFLPGWKSPIPGKFNQAARRKVLSRSFNQAAKRRRVNIKEWRANRKFLDRTIRRGDRIILSAPAHTARKGSGFHRELMYLRSKGYTVSRDGMRLRPPAGGAKITYTGRVSGKFHGAARRP